MKEIYHVLNSYNMAQFDLEITQLLAQLKPLSALQRLEEASAAFLGRPYLLGACGEGELGEFDQSPLYRTDGFDCVTYVNMVLAVCMADDLAQFKQISLALNYYKSNPSFLTRFHFMSVDWNVQNAMQGFVEDVTYTIKSASGEALSKDAKTTIDKPNWLLFRSLEDIKLLEKIDDKEANQRLGEMHQQAAFYHAIETITPYISLSDLCCDGQLNEVVAAQIPQGSVLEIVRPNWDLRQQIGTCINVSHVGFVIEKQQQLFYRQASSIDACVIDTPLADYLSHCIKSPTIAGVNLQLPSFL
jgi:hypothetical protein